MLSFNFRRIIMECITARVKTILERAELPSSFTVRLLVQASYFVTFLSELLLFFFPETSECQGSQCLYFDTRRTAVTGSAHSVHQNFLAAFVMMTSLFLFASWLQLPHLIISTVQNLCNLQSNVYWLCSLNPVRNSSCLERLLYVCWERRRTSWFCLILDALSRRLAALLYRVRSRDWFCLTFQVSICKLCVHPSLTRFYSTINM